MPETIVLGYDDSPSANAALAETIRVAPLLGTSVIVVFGFHMSALGGPITGGESRDFRAKLEQMGTRAVKRAVSDLEAAGIDVTTRLVEAKPADAILQVADEAGASMVVVGTVGENPISGALLGSVVLRLVQRSPVPVLVVPAAT
jgi:nucleotide-binding universal stress UspA family protein